MTNKVKSSKKKSNFVKYRKIAKTSSTYTECLYSFFFNRYCKEYNDFGNKLMHLNCSKLNVFLFQAKESINTLY